jgi:hypothetical protein
MQQCKYCIVIVFLLGGCSSPVIVSQKTLLADGNRLQITSGTNSAGRFVSVVNLDKSWVGKYAGGREKWGDRKNLFQDTASDEIARYCGGWAFRFVRPYTYDMLDHDKTMGGVAPILGGTAEMAGYLVAYSQTKDENIPVSIYADYVCRSDEE